jgi:hypothetical protein
MLRDSRWTINLYREGGVPMQDRDHRRFLDSQQGDIRDDRRARDPAGLPRETSLAKTLAGPSRPTIAAFPR